MDNSSLFILNGNLFNGEMSNLDKIWFLVVINDMLMDIKTITNRNNS